MDKVKTQDVLKLLAVGGVVLGSMVIPTLPLAAGALLKIWKQANRKDLGRIIKRLEKQEMISYQEENGLAKIVITEKGKRRLLAYDFQTLDIKKKKIDGKWRLVIFDIPESKKNNRESFRKKLIELGFIRIQDSAFASAYPCKSEIDFLCHFLEISDFVTLVVLDRIERGEGLLFKRYKYYEGME